MEQPASVDTGAKKHSGSEKIGSIGKGLHVKNTPKPISKCRSAGLFPGDQTLTQLVGTAAPCYFPTRERTKGTQVQAGLSSPHSSFKFTLNSLCSPSGIHYPAKDARVRLCPLQRRIRAHPPWSHNKPPLSFPFLQSKVAFKRRKQSQVLSPKQ